MLKKILFCIFSVSLFIGCQPADSDKESLKEEIEEKIEDDDNPRGIDVGPIPT